MPYLISKIWNYTNEIPERYEIIDIGINDTYPGNMLSNYYPHKFYFNGIICNSMEGLLQSFKVKDIDEQIYICSLVEYKAKKYSKKYNNNWQNTLILYWNNKSYNRLKIEYQKLLKLAYKSLISNKNFAHALENTKDHKLIHSIGKKDKTKTILTEDEFITRLYALRKHIYKFL